jgi:guanylate kinase
MSPKHASSGGRLVLLIGPSGVGKSVILKRLRERHSEFHFPRSATTRPKRKGEGTDLYRFVSEEEFDALIKQNKVLEWAVVHGEARYGTLEDEIIPFIEQGKTVIREVDVQGFDSIRNHSHFREPGAAYRLESIFIVPEDTKRLISRIKKRAPISDEELERRIASMEKEMTYSALCDHQIVNREGKLDETVAEIETKILK